MANAIQHIHQLKSKLDDIFILIASICSIYYILCWTKKWIIPWIFCRIKCAALWHTFSNIKLTIISIVLHYLCKEWKNPYRQYGTDFIRVANYNLTFCCCCCMCIMLKLCDMNMSTNLSPRYFLLRFLRVFFSLFIATHSWCGRYSVNEFVFLTSRFNVCFFRLVVCWCSDMSSTHWAFLAHRRL